MFPTAKVLIGGKCWFNFPVFLLQTERNQLFFPTLYSCSSEFEGKRFEDQSQNNETNQIQVSARSVDHRFEGISPKWNYISDNIEFGKCNGHFKIKENGWMNRKVRYLKRFQEITLECCVLTAHHSNALGPMIGFFPIEFLFFVDSIFILLRNRICCFKLNAYLGESIRALPVFDRLIVILVPNIVVLVATHTKWCGKRSSLDDVF